MRHDLQTPLCELLNIEYPVLSVGFGAAAGPGLVATVSNAARSASWVRAGCRPMRSSVASSAHAS